MVFTTPISLYVLKIKTFVNKDALFILSFYKHIFKPLYWVYCDRKTTTDRDGNIHNTRQNAVRGYNEAVRQSLWEQRK